MFWAQAQVRRGPTFSVLEKTPVESTQSSTPWIWTLIYMKLRWEYIRRAKAKTDENVRKSRGLEWWGGVEVEWGSLYSPPPPFSTHSHPWQRHMTWWSRSVSEGGGRSTCWVTLRIDVVITWAGEGEHMYLYGSVYISRPMYYWYNKSLLFRKNCKVRTCKSSLSCT